jgi:hypothetical protein
MFDCETLTGTHYEMGLQEGRIFRHLIRGNVHAYAMRHTFQGSDSELDAGLEQMRQIYQTLAPWVFEELRGIAEGSGVDYIWIERMHLRVWNLVPNKPLSPGGCTAIGMVTEEHGVVVGGTLDDPRQSYALVRRLPKEGIPHIQIIWPGTAFGQNGINFAGLGVATTSLGQCDPKLNVPLETLSLVSFIQRMLLETCRTASEAVALLKRVGCTGSFILGDADGNLIAAQSVGSLLVLEKPESNMVFYANHISIKELLEVLKTQGCQPVPTDYSRTRCEVLQRARKNLSPTLATMKALLRSHEGYPHSICNEGTVMASIAVTQSKTGKFYIADRPPCRNDFLLTF